MGRTAQGCCGLALISFHEQVEILHWHVNYLTLKTPFWNSSLCSCDDDVPAVLSYCLTAVISTTDYECDFFFLQALEEQQLLSM